jgi:Cdc6-like AAA superfamily ATPase
VVAVAGPRGIGKSELLIGALSYLIEREQLNCSKVVYIDAKSYQTSTDTAFALLERLGVCSGAHKASLSFSTFASSSDDRSALKLEEAKYELEVLLRHMQTASHKYMVFAFDNVDTIGDVATLADLVSSLASWSATS